MAAHLAHCVAKATLWEVGCPFLRTAPALAHGSKTIGVPGASIVSSVCGAVSSAAKGPPCAAALLLLTMKTTICKCETHQTQVSHLVSPVLRAAPATAVLQLCSREQSPTLFSWMSLSIEVFSSGFIVPAGQGKAQRYRDMPALRHALLLNEQERLAGPSQPFAIVPVVLSSWSAGRCARKLDGSAKMVLSYLPQVPLASREQAGAALAAWLELLAARICRGSATGGWPASCASPAQVKGSLCF